MTGLFNLRAYALEISSVNCSISSSDDRRQPIPSYTQQSLAPPSTD